MNIVSAATLFGVFLIAYIIIIEIFTVLFRLTGLTEEKARMQVISMLTNSGFTTAESEIIMTAKKRRKLARITMMFGYCITVIIVSLLVNFFLALNQTELKNISILSIIFGVCVIIIFIIARLQVVKRWFDHCIERIANRIMFGKNSNTTVIIDTYGASVMAEIMITNLPHQFQNTPLAKTNLKEHYHIQILLIKRGGAPLEHINGETILQKGDILVVFGPNKFVRELFENPTT